MRIDRSKNTYHLVLTREEAIVLNARLSDRIMLLRVRHENQKAQIGRGDTREKRDGEITVATFTNGNPDRNIIISLQDLPLEEPNNDKN